MKFVKLGDICSIKTGKLDANASSPNGKYPFFTCAKEPLKIDNYSYDCECVLVAGNGNLNVKYYNGKFDAYQRTYIIEINDKKLYRTKYIYLLIESKLDELRSQSIGGVIKYIKLGDLANIIVPKISISGQEEIIRKTYKLQNAISIKKNQIFKLNELIKSLFAEMFGNINDDENLSFYISSLDAGKSLVGEYECVNKVLKTGSVSYNYFDPNGVKNLPTDYKPLKAHEVKKGDVIISRMNTIELVGACGYVWNDVENLYYPDRLWRANLKNNCNAIYIWQSIIQESFKSKIREICSGTSGSMKNVSKINFLNLKIKKVPIELQDKFANIVRQIHKQKSKYEESLKKLDELQSALMQEYFG